MSSIRRPSPTRSAGRTRLSASRSTSPRTASRTDDDTRRIAFIDQALAGVRDCLDEGIPVHSYIYWSLLDNFEWTSGYAQAFRPGRRRPQDLQAHAEAQRAASRRDRARQQDLRFRRSVGCACKPTACMRPSRSSTEPVSLRALAATSRWLTGSAQSPPGNPPRIRRLQPPIPYRHRNDAARGAPAPQDGTLHRTPSAAPLARTRRALPHASLMTFLPTRRAVWRARARHATSPFQAERPTPPRLPRARNPPTSTAPLPRAVREAGT